MELFWDFRSGETSRRRRWLKDVLGCQGMVECGVGTKESVKGRLTGWDGRVLQICTRFCTHFVCGLRDIAPGGVSNYETSPLGTN